MVAQQKAKTMDGRIRPRSKDPPITSCTVHAQNNSWYKQKTISGKSGDPGDGADITSFRPKLAMFPIKGPAVRE